MEQLTLGQAANTKFQWPTIDRPSEELHRFVQQHADDREKKTELREATRYPAAMEVPGVPFDADERQCGKPIVMLSRNISTGGISLVYHRPVPATYLLIELSDGNGGSIRAVVEVVRCCRIGRFFEIAGTFREKLS